MIPLSLETIQEMREELNEVRNVMSLQEPTQRMVIHSGSIRLEPIEEE